MPNKTSTQRGLNIGGGVGVYSSISGNSLVFKTLSGGTGVTITGTTDNIIINSSGGGGSTGLTGATNGLTVSNNIVSLGGTLTGNTQINGGGNELIFGDLIDDTQKMSSSLIISTDSASLLVSNSTGSTCCSNTYLSKTEIGMCLTDTSVGGKNININQNNISISDSLNSLGMVYAADYSASGGTNPRWIPDAAWVTGQTSGGGCFIPTDINSSLFVEGQNDVALYFGCLGLTNTYFNQFAFLTTGSTLYVGDIGGGNGISTSYCAYLKSDVCLDLTSRNGITGLTVNTSTGVASYNADYFTGNAVGPRWIPDAAWVTGQTGGGGTPGGLNGEIQFNDNNSFNGSPFCYDDSLNRFGMFSGVSATTILTICEPSDLNYDIAYDYIRTYTTDGVSNFVIRNSSSSGNGESVMEVSTICGSYDNFNNKCELLITDNCGITIASPSGVTIGNNSGSVRCVDISCVLNIIATDTFPSTVKEGDMVRTKNHTLACADGIWVYNGTAWQSITTW